MGNKFSSLKSYYLFTWRLSIFFNPEIVLLKRISISYSKNVETARKEKAGESAVI